METTTESLQAQVLAQAKERRARVLGMRREGKTLAQIAKEMGISSQRASYMEQKALKDEKQSKQHRE